MIVEDRSQSDVGNMKQIARRSSLPAQTSVYPEGSSDNLNIEEQLAGSDMIGFKKSGVAKVYLPMGKTKAPKQVRQNALGKYLTAQTLSQAILEDDVSYHVDG